MLLVERTADAPRKARESAISVPVPLYLSVLNPLNMQKYLTIVVVDVHRKTSRDLRNFLNSNPIPRPDPVCMHSLHPLHLNESKIPNPPYRFAANLVSTDFHL